MALRWEDERYVRLFTRDTPDWLQWSYDAQCLFMQLLRKVDRAGLLPLGKRGKEGLASLYRVHWEIIAGPLEELLDDGCIYIEHNTLVIKNFVHAQETPSSDAKRAKEYRERAKHLIKGNTVVTDRHTPSHTVTGRSPVPSVLSVPSVPSVPKTEETNTPSASPRFDFEAVYNLYPRKEGKKDGLRRCRTQIKTAEKYEALLKAVRNYSTAKATAEPQYVLHFSSFMNGRWEDWIDPPAHANGTRSRNGIAPVGKFTTFGNANDKI